MSSHYYCVKLKRLINLIYSLNIYHRHDRNRRKQILVIRALIFVMAVALVMLFLTDKTVEPAISHHLFYRNDLQETRWTVNASNLLNSPSTFDEFISSSGHRLNYHNLTYLTHPGFLHQPNFVDNKLLIAVISTDKAIRRRRTIRSTIVRYAQKYNVKFSLMFVLGASKDAKYQKFLYAENAKHQDMLIVNVTEAYEHLTEKDVGWMKWVHRHCDNVRYVLKIDEDTIINIPKFLKLFDVCIMDSASNDPMCNKISCNSWRGVRPTRKGKNSVTYEQYPLNVLPIMCQGLAYLIPKDIIFKMLEASLHVPYLYLEDVYVTGILRQYIGESLHPLNEYYSSEYFDESFFSNKIIGHLQSDHEFEYVYIWKKMLQEPINETTDS